MENKKIKILCISDTHSKHRQIPLEWLDIEDKEKTILVHAGDISNIGRLEEIEEFCRWYSSLNFYKKIFIAGNHDWGFQLKPKEVAAILAKYPDLIYLQDNSVVIDGIKFFGTPWQPFFYNWSFNLQRGKELQEKWDMIEQDCDILISHGPVKNILDMTPTGEFVGCENLLNTVITKLNNTILMVSGHIHCAQGHVYKYGKTFLNASILNESYMVAYKPILIDFDKKNKIATVIK